MTIAVDDMNELPRLFVEAFPDWRDLDERCAIRLGVEVNQRDIAEEIATVTTLGGRSELIARMRLTHPANRVHIEEFDRHLWNSITEGVAFAWAAEFLPGSPAFTDDDGKPDLVAAGVWVEVKSVWESDDEREVLNKMADASERGTIIMRMASDFTSPHPVFLKKFKDGLSDALQKLQRQGFGRLVVFYALTGIDFGTNRDRALRELSEWASTASAEQGCGIVVSYRDRWRDPLVSVGV